MARSVVPAMSVVALLVAGCTGGSHGGPGSQRSSSTNAGRVAVSGVSSTPSVADPGAQPVLGLPNLFPYSEGFGNVKPARIFNGGDPTGLFRDITWDSWGEHIAYGHGTANYEPPNASVAESYAQPADFAAYDLTTCGEKPTYRHLAVWFPTHNEHFDPQTNSEASYDLCQR